MTIDQILSEWRDISAALDRLNERRNQLTDELRKLGVGAHTGTIGKVTVSPPAKRFDAKRAAEVLSPELLAMCTETVVSSAAAKRVLPPALYAECQTASTGAKGRVTVTIP